MCPERSFKATHPSSNSPLTVGHLYSLTAKKGEETPEIQWTYWTTLAPVNTWKVSATHCQQRQRH